MLDWKQYAGGLDTAPSLGTGKHSLYTEFEGKEFMFHVGMFLPFSETNRQQVERKRHVGNDVVVVIFKEQAATPFLPTLIASRFNHIFIVVSIERDEAGDESKYHVAVSSLEGVPSFGPSLPPNGIFHDPWNLRVFLLRKSKYVMCALPHSDDCSNQRGTSSNESSRVCPTNHSHSRVVVAQYLRNVLAYKGMYFYELQSLRSENLRTRLGACSMFLFRACNFLLIFVTRFELCSELPRT